MAIKVLLYLLHPIANYIGLLDDLLLHKYPNLFLITLCAKLYIHYHYHHYHHYYYHHHYHYYHHHLIL